MAEPVRIRVSLADIRPGNNPRRDFGDIDALAAAIEATGGQPVNPPVVARDANVYRLTDGERRVCALRKLHGEDGMADVLCYESLDEAEEAVAMLATDAKKGLTETERGMGFQRMIQLGVPEERVAKALHRRVGDVRKAARVAGIAPEQATLDQMIAAAEYEDEDEQREVLEAEEDKWERVKRDIDGRHMIAKANAPIEEELESFGIPIVEKVPDGYTQWGDYCGAPGKVSEWADGHDFGLAVAKRSAWGAGYYLHEPRPKQEKEVETEEQVAARELKARIGSDVENLALALMEHVAVAGDAPCLQATVGRLRGGGEDDLDELDDCYADVARRLKTQDVEDSSVAAMLRCPASPYEVLRAMTLMIDYWSWQWWRDVVCYLDAAKRDGYVPSSEDEWLYEQAIEERRRQEAEGGDDE